jgi:hypothetical protein
MVTAESLHRNSTISLENSALSSRKNSKTTTKPLVEQLPLKYRTIEEVYENLTAHDKKSWEIGTVESILQLVKDHYPDAMSVTTPEQLLEYLSSTQLELQIQRMAGDAIQGGAVTGVSVNGLAIGISKEFSSDRSVSFGEQVIYQIRRKQSLTAFTGNWKKELEEKHRLASEL